MFGREFLTYWLDSGAFLGRSEDQLLLGAGRITSGTSGQFYAPDFFLQSQTPWLRFEETLTISRSELLAALKDRATRSLPRLDWNPESRPRFDRIFEELQKEFRAGSLQKAVPYTFEQAECRMDGDRLLLALIETLEYARTPSVIPYGFWSDQEGILGCTPETLFRQDATGVHTMAVAGTRRGDDAAGRPMLLDDPKERREHQLVIDAIVSELSQFGKTTAHPTGIVKLPSLSHLKALIDLEPARDVGFEDLVHALHPTPALGAFPRERGWAWLREVEEHSPVKRFRYGAPFGARWQGGRGLDESLCVVAIRNVQWRGSRVFLCAGCGLIAESEREREWLELRSKIGAIKEIIGI